MLFIAVGLVAYLLLLCLLVLLQDFRRKTNITLALFSILLVAWLISIYLLATPIGTTLIYTRSVFVLGLWATAMLAWFTYELTTEDRASPILRNVFHGGFFVYLAMTVAVLGTPLIITNIQLQQGSIPIPSYGPAYWTYIVIIGLTIMGIIQRLILSYRRATGLLRRQLLTVAWTLGIAIIVAFMTNVIMPILTGSTQTALLFPVAVAVMMSGLSYAMARNGLLDIRAATVRSVAYVLSILTIAGIYVSLAYLASASIFKEGVSDGVSISPVNIVLALVLALIFQPVKQFFDRVTARIFLRESYDLQEVAGRISSACVELTDLNALISRTGGLISEALAPEYLLVLFNDNVHETVVVGRLPKQLQKPHATLRDELANMRVKPNELREKPGAIAGVYHLKTSSQHLGYVVVGYKQNSRLYSHNDMTLMNLSVDEMSIAIQNIFRLEEIRSFATTLEREVDDATGELRRSNKKLLELDATKDEFVGMASHQLRTPLTSVKGYISMVLEGDAGKITGQQRQLLQEAFTSSERMVHLIADFLNVSRLQTGKFVVDRKDVNLAEIIKQEVTNIKQIAATHDIRLLYKPSSRIPRLYLDEGKMRQVVMNFIDNAIYYSPDGTAVKITLTVEDGEVVLRVIDKGMGVPEEAQAKLFTKFFRAENARRQRPDGTGVGLFLAKKVIDGHKGSLVFESVVGKGSTFGFRLPIHKLSQPPNAEEQATVANASSA